MRRLSFSLLSSLYLGTSLLFSLSASYESKEGDPEDLAPVVGAVRALSLSVEDDLIASRRGVDLESEFGRISQTYGLSPQKYTESLAERYHEAERIVTQAASAGKKIGIVVGEDHTAEGAKCLEMLLLQVARSRDVHRCLVESTLEKLQRIMREGYGLGAEIGYLQRLIKEARRLEMRETPIDKDIEENELPGLEGLKETYVKGEEREKYFVEQILNINESFIFFTGANHLSTLYYDRELNDNFSLVFIDCSLPPKAKHKRNLEIAIRAIDDASVSRIHAQRERFLGEVDRSYKLPVMYNQRDSMIYRMLLKSQENLIGVNLKEIRDYNPGE